MQTLDLINQIAETTGLGSRGKIKASVKALILDILNMHYESIYDLYPWNDIKIINFSTTTSDGVVILPNYVDTIQAVRIGNNPIIVKSELHVWQFNPASFENAGSVSGYMKLPSRPLLTDAAAAGVLVFKSDSATDATASALTVRIEGEVSSVSTAEENDLNGTTNVTTTASYDAGGILQITKPLTTGRVTVYAADGTTELGTAGPDEYEFRYKRIQLNNIVDEATTVNFICTRRFERLRSDSDSILITGAQLAVMALAKAEVYDFVKKPEQAETERRKATAQLEVALQNEVDIDSSDRSIKPLSGGFNFAYPLNTGLDITPTGIFT